MGTLLEQPERKHYRVRADSLDAFIEDVIASSIKHKISVADVIEANKVLELERRNNLFVANGDIYDEQMSGLGALFETLISNLSDQNK